MNLQTCSALDAADHQGVVRSRRACDRRAGAATRADTGGKARTRPCAGSGSAIAVVPSSATSLPPSGSDQSAANSVDHRLEAVVRAELLIHMVKVIAKGLR